MRLFIALPLPATVKRTLSAVQDALRDDALPLDWQTRPRMHLTLHFLGEMDDSAPERLTECMETVARRHDAFPLQLDGLGAFPSLGTPRVVWMGLQPSPALTSLQAELGGLLVRTGFPTESRDYAPHITLARLRREPSPDEREGIRTFWHRPLPVGATTWTADRITLFLSHQDAHGLHYSPVAEARLRPA